MTGNVARLTRRRAARRSRPGSRSRRPAQVRRAARRRRAAAVGGLPRLHRRQASRPRRVPDRSGARARAHRDRQPPRRRPTRWSTSSRRCSRSKVPTVLGEVYDANGGRGRGAEAGAPRSNRCAAIPRSPKQVTTFDDAELPQGAADRGDLARADRRRDRRPLRLRRGRDRAHPAARPVSVGERAARRLSSACSPSRLLVGRGPRPARARRRSSGRTAAGRAVPTAMGVARGARGRAHRGRPVAVRRVRGRRRAAATRRACSCCSRASASGCSACSTTSRARRPTTDSAATSARSRTDGSPRASVKIVGGGALARRARRAGGSAARRRSGARIVADALLVALAREPDESVRPRARTRDQGRSCSPGCRSRSSRARTVSASRSRRWSARSPGCSATTCTSG